MAGSPANSSSSLTATANLPTITAFTMMCWVYRVGVATDQTIILLGQSSGVNFYDIFIDSGASDAFSMWNGSTVVNGPVGAVGRWYHIAMTVSGTGANQQTLFVDGVQVAQQAGNAANTSQKLYIGNNVFGEPMVGYLSGVKFWDAVLTPDEIMREAQQLSPVRIRGLNRFYPMLSGVRTVDFSVNHNDLTEAGTWSDVFQPPVPYALTVDTDLAVIPPDITITPAAIFLVTANVDPTAVLGSVTVTPAVSFLVTATVDPTATLGSVSVTPAPIMLVAAVVNPTVSTSGSIVITPAAIWLVVETRRPTVSDGSPTIYADVEVSATALFDAVVYTSEMYAVVVWVTD